MPRGGWRPGAGRPRKTGLKIQREDGFAEDIAHAADRSGMTPLKYMLSVMRNPKADWVRRDRVAIAAAPFCHSRMTDRQIGKKDIREAAARKVGGAGSEWGDDLAVNCPQ